MSGNESIPRLMKINEVAAILQISRTSAYRLAATGEIPCVRFGRATVRVRPEDLEWFIQASRSDDHREIAA